MDDGWKGSQLLNVEEVRGFLGSISKPKPEGRLNFFPMKRSYIVKKKNAQISAQRQEKAWLSS